MCATYYNENDPFAAEWLRRLIAEGLIAEGEVDERSIEDVEPADVRGFSRCHFFAGIAGWDLALALAGWPADAPVWTGSCPCQPFSSAGKREGFDDERHLWPAWRDLIRECRPSVVFGEQTESTDGWAWLSAVRADLEASGYAVGAACLPAAGIGAPHGRHRLWFVANATGKGQRAQPLGAGEAALSRSTQPRRHRHARSMGDSIGPRLQERPRPQNGCRTVRLERPSSAATSILGGAWAGAEWLPCSDGKLRPVEAGTFPLAQRLPGDVGKLRAFGNAIVPQVAAEFVGAFLEAAS